MANPQNLVSNEDRTPSQRRENASKAGKASAAKRAERKIFKEAILSVLSEPLTDKAGNPHPSGMNVQEAMIRGVIGRAIKGDPRALEVIRDTIGEKPVEKLALTTPDTETITGVESVLFGGGGQ